MTDNQKAALELLNSIKDARLEIASIMEEVELLRHKASGVSAIRYDKDKVQTSPQEYMTMALADALEYEAEAEAKKLSLDHIIATVYSVIRTLPDRTERKLLECIYVNGERVTDSFDKIGVSSSTFYRYKSKALESFGCRISQK